MSRWQGILEYDSETHMQDRLFPSNLHFSGNRKGGDHHLSLLLLALTLSPQTKAASLQSHFLK